MRLVADEDFNNRIFRGVLSRLPYLDALRVQDIGLSGATDAELLHWAAVENRVLLTHDAASLIDLANNRVTTGKPMPGVVLVNQTAPIGKVIEQLVIVIECSHEGEWDNRICYLPW
jgi:predicted nuclease of predicted toxin-antitoxin system